MKSRRSYLQPLIMGVTILIMTYSPRVSAQNHTLLIQRQTIASRVNYIGLNINYSCTLTYLLSTPRIEEVEVDISFSGPGIRRNSNNVQLSEVMLVRRGNRFQRLLEFHPMTTQDAGSYHCNATIMSDNMVLIRTPQQTRDISVSKPRIDISLDPVNPVLTRYLNIAPYNSLSFICSAIITAGGTPVNLSRIFSWQHTIGGSSSNISAEFFTGSQSITSGSSVLSINATEAGIHTYTCTVTLDVSPAPDIITSNSSQTQTIIGASSPAMPVNVRISRESLLHNRSTVQWLVSSITYDQEYYVVQYGLSESNLNMNSSRITSGPNITRVNFLLSVELSDLMVGTKYYYRVTATNSAGTNSSTITSSFNMTSNHEESNVDSIVDPTLLVILSILILLVIIVGVIIAIIIVCRWRNKKNKWGVYQIDQGGIPNVVVEESSHPFLTSDKVQGPWGIAIDKEGHIIVADNEANSLHFFTSTGEPIPNKNLQLTCVYRRGTFASKTRGQDLNKPSEIAIDASGNILVTDRYNHCVKKFLVDGQSPSLVHCTTNRSNQDRYAYWPTGISIFDNKVYVTDTLNKSVNVLNAEDLSECRTLGKSGSSKGKFHSPTCIACDKGEFHCPTSVACDKDGKIYVVDNENHRVKVFSPDGNFISTFGGSGGGDGRFNYPVGITIDRSNDILYVSDRGNKRISVFKSNGRFVKSFCPKECKDFDPCGLTVDTNGKLYVCEFKTGRVLSFEITIL